MQNNSKILAKCNARYETNYKVCYHLITLYFIVKS